MTAAKIGPQCSPVTLAKIDGRTREARLMRQTRTDLIRHIGGKPSAVQVQLIEQAVSLRVRIAMKDRKFAETGQQNEHDSKTYLSWTNTFSRLLLRLGVNGEREHPMDLATYLAAKAAAARSAGADAADDPGDHDVNAAETAPDGAP